jgi:hypothetical protein
MGAPAIPEWQWVLIDDAIDRAVLGELGTIPIPDGGDRERIRQAVLRRASWRRVLVRTAVTTGALHVLPPV